MMEAVAEVLGDVAVEAADHLGAGGLVRADDIAEILRIQARRESGRVGEVAEHDRELAALGLEGARRRTCRGDRCDPERRLATLVANLAADDNVAPHLAQARLARAVPHSSQNLAPERFSC
jgi:hypothetical protein